MCDVQPLIVSANQDFGRGTRPRPRVLQRIPPPKPSDLDESEQWDVKALQLPLIGRQSRKLCFD